MRWWLAPVQWSIRRWIRENELSQSRFVDPWQPLAGPLVPLDHDGVRGLTQLPRKVHHLVSVQKRLLIDVCIYEYTASDERFPT